MPHSDPVHRCLLSRDSFENNTFMFETLCEGTEIIAVTADVDSCNVSVAVVDLRWNQNHKYFANSK